MRKRLTSILLTLAMLVGLLPALSPQAEAAADDATALLQEVSTKTSVPSGYTPIYDAEDLANIANDMTGKYILMNDIDLSGINWKPLEAKSTKGLTTSFTGILEGNGYTIRNLSCTNEVKAGLGGPHQHREHGQPFARRLCLHHHRPGRPADRGEPRSAARHRGHDLCPRNLKDCIFHRFQESTAYRCALF